MRALVTRPLPEAAQWADALRARGVDAVALPLIRIGASGTSLHASQLQGICAVMFVSANAVRHGMAGIAGWPAGVRAWATGPGTAQALADAGVPPELVDAPDAQSPQFDSEALWARVVPSVVAGARYFIVRGADAGPAGQLGRDWLHQRLVAAGASVETVVSYVRELPQWGAAEHALALEAGAVWIFSSSQAIAHLQVLVPGHPWHAARAVATHPRIADAARNAGFGVVRVSRPAVDAVAAALEFFR